MEDRYRPDERDRPLQARIAATVLTALRETSDDILVFLPGGGEIRACCEFLRATLEGKAAGISIHPLYGDLPFEEQERAILPSAKRRIVLATNIAETNLSIEGVKVVIDSGLTRRFQHDPATGMNRLVTVAVSRAAAEQRKGRAGRLGPGVAAALAPYGWGGFQSMQGRGGRDHPPSPLPRLSRPDREEARGRKRAFHPLPGKRRTASFHGRLAKSPFIIAAHVDAGEKAGGATFKRSD